MSQVNSTEVLSDDAQADGRRYIHVVFHCEDNQGGLLDYYIGPRKVPADFDINAWMTAQEPVVIATLTDNENQDFISASSATALLFHNDLGGFYEERNTKWGVWNDQITYWLKYWLAQTDQLMLINIQADMAALSNTDVRNLLGLTNQDVSAIRADIQVAVDTQTSLNSYVPWFSEDDI